MRNKRKLLAWIVMFIVIVMTNMLLINETGWKMTLYFDIICICILAFVWALVELLNIRL